ncbi:hypothetical protein RAE07_11395 [Corynebacterium kefirresidentii]|uniref:hypothetical protein n=1 Tax=Corynebacterium sp. CTNIH14 TaxID=3230065 RepID=UPI002935086C|nr:hypothetical protein [Corynebacterium kefirresidentii]MDV2415911.1 hypothetical protein [Corynebacterium kefirresidentii]
MKYTRVRRAVSAVVIDSWDEDRNPEHIKVNGNVTFRPLLNDGDVVQWAGPNGPESLVLAPIQCRISDGIIMHRGGEGVYLAAGGEGCEPDLIQWKAEFSSMQAGGWSFKLKPVMFDAVPDGEVDLTMVAPVAGASEPIVRGPAGTGIDNIKVDGAELVITARSEAGVFEMARIPLEDVVRAEADAAAKSAADSAADNVRTEFTTAATSAKDSATAAAASAKTASTKASEATTQATNAKTSATAAKTSETNAASSASSAATSAAKAEGSATTAATSAQTATSKASEVTTQAVNAANSAGAAKTSETNALSSANAAKSSESSAAASESSAKESAIAAKDSASSASSSASKASTSEKNAAKSASAAAESASQAAGSATSAKQEADRAANVANSTSWNGDRLTVNGKTSPSLRGPKGDPGASTMADISDLPEITPLARENAVVQRLANGHILVLDDPPNSFSAVNKGYVDTAVAAEKARTVGITWTVPRESDVAAKASAAQTGDYIQVAQTKTIYRVTSSGVEVERYGTRTLQASTDATSNRNPNQWLDNDDPWAGVNWSRVSPPAGKWLVELINQHDFSASLYVSGKSVGSVTKGTMSYIAEFSTAAKSDVYVQIPGDNYYKPLALRFTPIN